MNSVEYRLDFCFKFKNKDNRRITANGFDLVQNILCCFELTLITLGFFAFFYCTGFGRSFIAELTLSAGKVKIYVRGLFI